MGEQKIFIKSAISVNPYKKRLFFNIYVPTAYVKKGEKLPVLYMLHGAYGSQDDWTTKTKIVEIAEKYKMIIVFPDGSQFGWYIDSPTIKDSNYESYLIKELIPYVDQHYETNPIKDARGIMGLSMGGHGAITLASKYPNLFISTSSLSGILKISDHPDKKIAIPTFGDFKKYPENWTNNSAWELAEKLKNKNVRILFDCGEDDTKTGAIQDCRKYHERLVSLCIPHIWREHTGTHSWKYWNDHLEEHLIFHRASFNKATANKHYFKMMAQFYEENAQQHFTQIKRPVIALLGSSSIQGFKKYQPKGYTFMNRGIAGDDIGIKNFGIGRRLETSVFDFDPDYLLIFNGRNDLSFWNRYEKGKLPLEEKISQMITEYERILLLVKKRLPNCKITIITCPGSRGKYSYLIQPTIAYDQALRKLAQKHNFGLIDLFQIVSDPQTGELLKEYAAKDGLHLKTKGYKALGWEIEQILKKEKK